MADPAHIAGLTKGVERWNEWRKESPTVAVDLTGADLQSRDLRGIDLSSCRLDGAKMQDILLDNANLSGASLQKASLAGASLHGATLVAAQLSHAVLHGADFAGADLRGANLLNAEGRGAGFSGAVFTDKRSYLASTMKGANFSRGDFAGAMMALVDLSDATLTRARLAEATLVAARLAGADFTGADLADSRLDLADCRKTVFRGALLKGARVRGTQFDHADLSEVDFQEATLIEASVTGANFTACVFGRTIFASVDLRGALGLQAAIHRAPSVIDIDSATKLSRYVGDQFLVSFGVHDVLVPALRSVAEEPAGDRLCFISYSRRDEAFASKLHRDLQARGVRAWLFGRDAKVGEPIWKEIDDKIARCHRLIVICSRHSLVSVPVLREVERALNREDRERRVVLCPLRLDAYILDDWEHFRKADVVDKVIADFSGWRRNAQKYEAELERLLLALDALPQR